MDIANEIRCLNYESDENRNKISYTVRMNSLLEKEGAIAARAHNLAILLNNVITTTEYTELAKIFFSLNDLEKAEKYHLNAVNKASGTSGIASKRSYADFLFLTGKVSEGRDQYQKCLIVQTTDANKAGNIKTLQMWMYNEGKLGNTKEKETIYKKATDILEHIGDIQLRKSSAIELEKVYTGLL